MLPESAIRHTEAAYVEISAADFFAPRMIALLNQANEYRRHYAEIGQPVDTEPTTLTGDAWRNAVDTEIDAVLELIY